jgi:hypothetical protein
VWQRASILCFPFFHWWVCRMGRAQFSTLVVWKHCFISVFFLVFNLQWIDRSWLSCISLDCACWFNCLSVVYLLLYPSCIDK